MTFSFMPMHFTSPRAMRKTWRAPLPAYIGWLGRPTWNLSQPFGLYVRLGPHCYGVAAYTTRNLDGSKECA